MDTQTPLMIAAMSGELDRVMLLVALGANVNSQDEAGFTALMYSASFGYKDIVKTLLNSGANPHLKSVEGHTALWCAQQNKHAEVTALLSQTNSFSNNKSSVVCNFCNKLVRTRRLHKHIKQAHAAENKALKAQAKRSEVKPFVSLKSKIIGS